MKISFSFPRGKTVFFYSALSVSLIVVSIIAAVTIFSQRPQEIVSTSFTCHSESTNQTFTTAAAVNLTDGMDETEAIILASKVFDYALAVDTTGSTLQSATVLNTSQSAETWKITLERIYTTTASIIGIQHGYAPIISQRSWTLQATINSTNQTIQFTTQKST